MGGESHEIRRCAVTTAGVCTHLEAALRRAAGTPQCDKNAGARCRWQAQGLYTRHLQSLPPQRQLVQYARPGQNPHHALAQCKQSHSRLSSLQQQASRTCSGYSQHTCTTVRGQATAVQYRSVEGCVYTPRQRGGAARQTRRPAGLQWYRQGHCRRDAPGHGRAPLRPSTCMCVHAPTASCCRGDSPP
jgi:hypothetical protein